MSVDRVVEVGEVPTWTIRGGVSDRASVLLLHGGLADSRDLWDSVGPLLRESFDVLAFDRRGHGRTPDTPEAFHYQAMADETAQLLSTMDVTRTHVVGWSDGGIIALLLALSRPELVDRMVLLGTNYHHSGIQAPDLTEGSPLVAALRAEYAALAPDGEEHFPAVLEKYLAMATTEPSLTAEDLARIGAPTLVLSGDDDLVPLEHTVSLFEALREAELGVIPGSSHMVALEQSDLVAEHVRRFLTADLPAATYLPVRRA